MEEILFKKGDTVVITDLGVLKSKSFTVGNAYVLRADYCKNGFFRVEKDDEGDPNGWSFNPYNKGLKVELYKETLQDKKQRLERELKEVNAEIESNEPKVGDWCYFWDDHKESFLIGVLHDLYITKKEYERNTYANLDGFHFYNCKKITDKDLLTKLNEIKID